MNRSSTIYVNGYYRYSRLARIRRQREQAKLLPSFLLLFYIALLAMLLLYSYAIKVLPPKHAHAFISPLAKTLATSDVALTTMPQEWPVLSQASINQHEIEKYVTLIFGSQAKMAIAISQAECNPANPQYPECSNISSIEHSIGIFQINLQSKYAKVHYDRVPGKTLEEKEEWLKNPYNNTLFAYWVYSKSDWFPWSTFTNGAYEANL